MFRKKVVYSISGHNFCKFRPYFQYSFTDKFTRTSICICHGDFHVTRTTLLRVTFENSKTLVNEYFYQKKWIYFT